MKEDLQFNLSSTRSFEEIMCRSSSYVDDYTLGLQFLSNVSGEFCRSNGEVIKLIGKCYNEYEGGALNPSKLQ